MPPKVTGPPRKEACILIVDVGASMAAERDDGQPTGLDNAKRAIQMLIQQKLLFTKQDGQTTHSEQHDTSTRDTRR